MPFGKNMAGAEQLEDMIFIEDMYDRYAHLVYRRCLMLLGNVQDAEDALQDVYIRVMKASSEFRGECSPMTWLYRISTNHCLNLIRSARRRIRAEEKKKLQTSQTARATIMNWEDIDLMRRLLASVDRSTQEIVVYHILDGMNQQEVASQTNLSVPTVRKRLKFFLRKAKCEL